MPVFMIVLYAIMMWFPRAYGRARIEWAATRWSRRAAENPIEAPTPVSAHGVCNTGKPDLVSRSSVAAESRIPNPESRWELPPSAE